MKVDEPSVQIRVGDPVSAGGPHGSQKRVTDCTVPRRLSGCYLVRQWLNPVGQQSNLEGQNRRSWCRDCSHVIAGSSRVGTTVMTRVLDRIEP